MDPAIDQPDDDCDLDARHNCNDTWLWEAGTTTRGLGRVASWTRATPESLHLFIGVPLRFLP